LANKPSIAKVPTARVADDSGAADVPLGVAALYRDYAAFVWRILRAMGVREADLPDMTQEVFVVVYRRLPELRARSSLRSWLYGICIRCAANYRRRAYRVSERLYAVVPEVVEASSDAAARLDLMRALQTLDEARRAVFVLYEIEELSMPEVAEALGCALTTAYSRLYSARRAVRRYFWSSREEVPQ